VGVESIAWVGFVAFFIASLVVGVRLVALWHRNRQLPELLIGLGVLGIGPVGFGFMTIARVLVEDHALAARAVLAIGLLATSGGAFAEIIFNTYVYHRGNRLVHWVAGLSGVALLLCFVAVGTSTGFAAVDSVDAPFVGRTAITIACLLWGSIEALRYWRLMSRRGRLGLADPIVTNRFLLWGVGAGAAGVGTAVGLAAQWWTGLHPLAIPWVMFSSSLHGSVAAVAMWFAFLPPAAYRRRLTERAGANAA
jgi:hypothetical protein